MTDPDLHPLPITPNDPLSIFQTNSATRSESKVPLAKTDSQLPDPILSDEPNFNPAPMAFGIPQEDNLHVDMEISNTGENPNSMFDQALPSLKLNTENKLSAEQINMIE